MGDEISDHEAEGAMLYSMARQSEPMSASSDDIIKRLRGFDLCTSGHKALAADEIERLTRELAEMKVNFDQLLVDDTRQCAELASALAEVERLTRERDALEALRPHWAKGYTSDSVAAQVTTAALIAAEREVERLTRERDDARYNAETFRKSMYSLEERIVELRKVEKLREAGKALSEFAWSAVRADCIEAAEYLNTLVRRLRDALDAAVEAQGLDAAWSAGRSFGRAEAFEEAVNACSAHEDDDALDRQAKAECADAIRALAKGPTG